MAHRVSTDHWGDDGLPGLSHINEKLIFYYDAAGSAPSLPMPTSKYISSQQHGWRLSSLALIETAAMDFRPGRYEFQSGPVKGLAVAFRGQQPE